MAQAEAAAGTPVSRTQDGRHGVSLGEAFRVWARIAALSFGGPAGQIAVMHRILVEEKRWIGEERFLHALNYCMLLPGPEAQQLAVYIGWLMHRTVGGLVAGILFVLPGVIAIMALSWLYATLGTSASCRACSSASRRRCWPSCWKPWSASAGGRSRTG
jgi:chromate transporter